MPGFFISNYKVDIALEDKYANSCVTETIENAKFTLERNTLDKFMDDKLFAEDEDVILITEGVFLNKKELSGKKTWFETVKQLLSTDETGYFDVFRGNFAGAHYNKKNKKWIIYTDPFGTKHVYYYQNGENWIVASEVRYITDALKKLGLSYIPNQDAAYDILSYGFMVDNTTLIKGIKKIPYGSYMIIENGKMDIVRYFDFSIHTGGCDMTENEIIDRMDELFKEAVRLQFEKDKEYGYSHLATLSGGFDSRMTVWVAAEMGYSMLNVTFGNANCMDEQVAKKVAKALDAGLVINTLDNGDMLLAHKPTTYMNAGQSLYSGIAHSYLTLKTINLNEYGLLHTGDVGGAVVSAYIDINEKKYIGAYSKKLAHKTKKGWDGIESIEKFELTTRAFNGTCASKSVPENLINCVTPFLYRDFFVFCLEKIPFELRNGHNIYKKWILRKYPAMAKLPYQSLNNGFIHEGKLKQLVRKVKRIGVSTVWNWALWKLNIKKSLDLKTVKTSMNPFDMWYEEKGHIRTDMDNCFTFCVEELALKKLIDDVFINDIKFLYNDGTVREKTQVITVLEAFRQLFAN